MHVFCALLCSRITCTASPPLTALTVFFPALTHRVCELRIWPTWCTSEVPLAWTISCNNTILSERIAATQNFSHRKTSVNGTLLCVKIANFTIVMHIIELNQPLTAWVATHVCTDGDRPTCFPHGTSGARARAHVESALQIRNSLLLFYAKHLLFDRIACSGSPFKRRWTFWKYSSVGIVLP